MTNVSREEDLGLNFADLYEQSELSRCERDKGRGFSALPSMQCSAQSNMFDLLKADCDFTVSFPRQTLLKCSCQLLFRKWSFMVFVGRFEKGGRPSTWGLGGVYKHWQHARATLSCIPLEGVCLCMCTVM